MAASHGKSSIWSTDCKKSWAKPVKNSKRHQIFLVPFFMDPVKTLPMNDPKPTEPGKFRRVFGRKQGKPLRGARAIAIESLLPKLQINTDLLKEDGTLKAETLFNQPVKTLHFEIGFGNGEHLKHIMETHPSDHFIGAEPFINGMSMFLKSIEDQPHDHVRVNMNDALMVLRSLEDKSVDVLYILNPDPWPKVRHNKRRIVGTENLKVYARVLKDGGTMIQTTDVDDLAQWMEDHTLQNPHFKLVSREAPDGWMSTRYEEKGRAAGRKQTYLVYKKRP